MPVWTEAQKKAIETKAPGLLVSAAAGSGKTAVLSHRVAFYVSGGGSVERLLVVTFTRAAAAEMKQRIISVLSEKFHASPDAHMREQLMLVNNAKISTIDGFCGELLRNNFQVLSLSPDFGVLDETEYSAIRAECLENLLEDYFTTYKNDFSELLYIFGGDSNSLKLSAALDKLYNFLQSIPFPEKWLDLQVSKYNSVSFWTAEACASLLPVFESYSAIYSDIAENAPFNEKGMNIVMEELSFLDSIVSYLSCGDWDGACNVIGSYSFKTSPRCPAENLHAQKYKKFRNMLKEELKSEIFLIDSFALNEDLSRLGRGIKALFSVVNEYRAAVEKQFRSRNRYSFDFISSGALSLLVKDYNFSTGEFLPTDLASEFSEKFDEVLIDEYQDVNDLQDLLFRALTCDGRKLFAVGDVKQSIYGFRLANPGNFLKKKDILQVIDLNRNFRSKKSILDFINFVFEPLFSKEVTAMEYDSAEKLYAGKESHCSEDDVEIHFCSLPEKKEDADSHYVQAELCARRIKELIKSGYLIKDKDSGSERPVELSDFALLMRTKKHIPVYNEVFRSHGIPVSLESGLSFWDCPEVNVLLAFLRAVDDPYDDLSVFAVLISEMFMFSADEIAKLRIDNRTASLYEIIKKHASADGKCADFIRALEHFYIFAQNFPLYKLVWEVLTRTGYLAKVSCLDMGYLKRENLLKFYSFSRKYSDSLSGGLHSFLKFSVLAAERGESSEKSSGEKGDFVKIMTIHNSKGLEFPVCIIPELSSEFNLMDIRSNPLLIDEKLGVATKIRDEEMLYETTTFQKELIGGKKLYSSVAEELRIFYVAMTRAREKLILISAGKKFGEDRRGEVFSQACLCMDKNKKIYPVVTVSDMSYEKFILQTIVHHPAAAEVHSNFSINIPSESGVKIFFHSNDEAAEKDEEKTSSAVIGLDIPELERRFSFRYDASLSSVPAKLSVTELSKGLARDGEAEEFFKEAPVLRKPLFLSEEKLSPTERGSAVHAFCHYADFNKAPAEELERLVDGYFLTPSQAESIDINKIRKLTEWLVPGFLDKASGVVREENFVTKVPSGFYSGDFSALSGHQSGENMLLQGAVDLLCDFEEYLILIDYKTDKCSEAELRSRYSAQLFLYKYAVEKIYGKKVAAIYLWSFHLSAPVQIKGFPAEKC